MLKQALAVFMAACLAPAVAIGQESIDGVPNATVSSRYTAPSVGASSAGVPSSTYGVSTSAAAPVGTGLSTWYDPYYYGYSGVFYPNYGTWRGWYISRRWRNVYSPGSYAPTGYPYFYQQHFAAFPGQYFYPQYYYPTYYYYAPRTYSYFTYPQAPVIITQPYAPLIKNDAPVQPSLENAPEAKLAEQIVAAATRQPSDVRFVSTDEQQVTAEIPVANDHVTAQLMFSSAFHAYWRADYSAAQKQLAEAVAADNQDARIWYYKGLTELALEQDQAAASSFGEAVKLHIAQPEQNAQVNKALERVQGDVRLQLHRAKRKVQSELAAAN